MCDVESHPFDLDTMLFMDWRDDHTQGHPKMRASNQVLHASSIHLLALQSQAGQLFTAVALVVVEWPLTCHMCM